jgi:DNA-binding NarL/FixJ family response regulator
MDGATFMEYLSDLARTKVLLGVDAFLFCDLLSELLSDEPDFEVVGHSADPIDLLAQVGELNADCVMLSWPASGDVPEICSHLFAEYPNLLVIGISPEGGNIFICRQSSSVARYSSHCLEEMLRIIRHARTEKKSTSTAGPETAGTNSLSIPPPSHF